MSSQRAEPNAPRCAVVGSCPICGCRRAESAFKGIDRLHGIPGEFTYRRCQSCETIYQDPRVVPEDLPSCYPRTYYTHSPCEAPASHPHRRRLSELRDSLRRSIKAAVSREGGRRPHTIRLFSRSRWVRERAFANTLVDELIPRTESPGRALEVGCGSGALMASLRAAGWEIEGVEWDPHAGAVAAARGTGSVAIGDFRTLELPEATYQLVVLDHVLEHIDNPATALQRIAALLAPGGRAVLRYPNPVSLGSRVFGDRWFPWDIPRHLVLPHPASLAHLARKKTGLHLESQRSSARTAVNVFAYSRSYASGRPVHIGEPHANFSDRVLGLVEGCLVQLGFQLGEELVIVFRKECDEEPIRRRWRQDGSVRRRTDAKVDWMGFAERRWIKSSVWK